MVIKFGYQSGKNYKTRVVRPVHILISMQLCVTLSTYLAEVIDNSKNFKTHY